MATVAMTTIPITAPCPSLKLPESTFHKRKTKQKTSYPDYQIVSNNSLAGLKVVVIVIRKR